MSLQTNVTNWLNAYNEQPIQNSHNADYIGSILGTNGQFHTGGGIYDQSSSLPYEIFDFNWYAGQGLTSGFGGKYLLHSENGLSWDTVFNANQTAYNFVTTGSLDTLYLGYSADSDFAPAQSTLTAFDEFESLLVVNNFNVAVDYVAGLFGGANGNSQINTSSLVDGNGDSLVSYPQYYEQVTLNSAIIYDLAFEAADSSSSTFEYVLDAYLSGVSGGSIDIGNDISVINSYLSSNGSSLSFEYYDEAGDYAASGVVTASAPVAEVESDLLLAA
ncbi:hypothetical protein [Pseudomonas sp. FME51]|uniref:hypothetical protein n=1 Tax=Pseudomonas sp. FME51 TaxID=2742609 RepID=UPI0018660D79|nr:hypothetical protein [Pseudomonas sp. FME51]